MKNHLSTLLSGLALFVALGGTSYAAFALPRASVGGRELKPAAVTSAKIADGTVRPRDLALSARAGSAGPAGPRGEPGAPGPAGGGTVAGGERRTLASVVCSTDADLIEAWIDVPAPSKIMISVRGEVQDRTPFDEFTWRARLWQENLVQAYTPLLFTEREVPATGIGEGFSLARVAGSGLVDGGNGVPETVPAGRYLLRLQGWIRSSTGQPQSCDTGMTATWLNTKLDWVVMPV